MKLLALTVLVIALSAVTFAQTNGRRGSPAPARPPADFEDSIPILEPKKPFVPPCGTRQKLEANCNAGKTESTKEVNKRKHCLVQTTDNNNSLQ